MPKPDSAGRDAGVPADVTVHVSTTIARHRSLCRISSNRYNSGSEVKKRPEHLWQEHDPMARWSLAFTHFFRALRDPDWARSTLTTQVIKPAAAEPQPVKPARSEALSLLSILQQEGRLIDFFKEPIADYTDAQIGAAVRDIHRDCAASLERLLAIRPLRSETEGSKLEVPTGFDPQALRLTGNVAGPGPFSGSLRHPGWKATAQNLPQWTGQPQSAGILAPAEVEIP